MRFVARLRGEVKFDGVEALVDQIQRDCDDRPRGAPRGLTAGLTTVGQGTAARAMRQT